MAILICVGVILLILYLGFRILCNDSVRWVLALIGTVALILWISHCGAKVHAQAKASESLDRVGSLVAYP